MPRPQNRVEAWAEVMVRHGLDIIQLEDNRSLHRPKKEGEAMPYPDGWNPDFERELPELKKDLELIHSGNAPKLLTPVHVTFLVPRTLDGPLIDIQLPVSIKVNDRPRSAKSRKSRKKPSVEIKKSDVRINREWAQSTPTLLWRSQDLKKRLRCCERCGDFFLQAIARESKTGRYNHPQRERATRCDRTPVRITLPRRRRASPRCGAQGSSSEPTPSPSE